MNREQLLVWIDLEMTGLVPEKDKILEIASVVTDNNLNIIEQGPSLVINHDESILQLMNEWVLNQHTKSGLIDKVLSSKVTLLHAEQVTIDFLNKYCEAGASPLCGNSVCLDRYFMRLHMPRIIEFLHYRIIDVTSFKEAILRWYPTHEKKQYVKKDNHRALDDILESIDELRYYREHFFV